MATPGLQRFEDEIKPHGRGGLRSAASEAEPLRAHSPNEPPPAAYLHTVADSSRATKIRTQPCKEDPTLKLTCLDFDNGRVLRQTDRTVPPHREVVCQSGPTLETTMTWLHPRLPPRRQGQHRSAASIIYHEVSCSAAACNNIAAHTPFR